MKQKPVIVGLGEVLWDVFPDGPRFGGAPANFACSAAGLGQDTYQVLMASAVGNDELGQKALKALSDHDVDVAAVEQLEYPTGQVHVTLSSDGQASYEFAPNCAWDHLVWRMSLKDLAERTDAVCFGTLGQRSEASRRGIERFVQSTPQQALRIFDVNLRPPFWSAEVILSSLSKANVLKLNDAELPILAGLLKLEGDDEQILWQIMSRYALKVAALTRGSKGSLLLRNNGERSDNPGKPITVVDTVGAGDSFTATLAIGLLSDLPLDTIHRWASEVAAFVCTQAGATPRLPQSLCSPHESGT